MIQWFYHRGSVCVLGVSPNIHKAVIYCMCIGSFPNIHKAVIYWSEFFQKGGDASVIKFLGVCVCFFVGDGKILPTSFPGSLSLRLSIYLQKKRDPGNEVVFPRYFHGPIQILAGNYVQIVSRAAKSLKLLLPKRGNFPSKQNAENFKTGTYGTEISWKSFLELVDFQKTNQFTKNSGRNITRTKIP